MKKTLFGLWAVLCAICVFTACSDDETSGSGNWQDLSKTYEGRYMQLVLGENIVPIYGKSVAVKASSETAAEITLNNVLPENKALTVNAALRRGEDAFAFSGQTSVGAIDFTIQGSIKNGVLSMVTKRNVNLPVVGDWKLKYTKVSANPAAVIYANVKTGNPQMDLIINSMASPVVGQLLAKKVDAVHVDFRANGTVGISWKKVGEEQMTDINKYLEIVNLQYCLIDGACFLVIDKNFIDIATSLGKEFLAENGIQVEELMKLFVDSGGYYGLPLQASLANGTATFYADKAFILPVISMVMPLISSRIPAGFEDTIKAILALLPTSEKLELGLVFEK